MKVVACDPNEGVVIYFDKKECVYLIYLMNILQMDEKKKIVFNVDCKFMNAFKNGLQEVLDENV